MLWPVGIRAPTSAANVTDGTLGEGNDLVRDAAVQHQRARNFAVNVADGLRHAFSEVALRSPSRSSNASREPVDAPEGEAANPRAPSASTTSAATVGLPRESRISNPVIFEIAAMDCL